MELRGIFLALFFVLAIFIMPLVSADVISLNSGGTGNIILNPDSYIESFFFSGESASAVCGNGITESGEQCDDGNTVSGDGCSSTCQTESDDGGDTGGGGGGSGGVVISEDFNITPEQFNINMEINTNVERTISVTNLGTNTQTFVINQQNLDNNVIIGTQSLTVAPGETETFDVIFVAPSEPGIITGRIYVGGKSVLVSLNVQTELLLFDSNIVVLNDDYQVEQGGELRTLATLIPFGEDIRLDVTLDYEVKDYDGNIYFTKSEPILVTQQMDVRRNFDTGNLPLGDYIIGLEIVYPNGVAPSSAHFEVIEKISSDLFGRIILFFLILILIVLIMIILVIIKRKLDERKRGKGVLKK